MKFNSGSSNIKIWSPTSNFDVQWSTIELRSRTSTSIFSNLEHHLEVVGRARGGFGRETSSCPFKNNSTCFEPPHTLSSRRLVDKDTSSHVAKTTSSVVSTVELFTRAVYCGLENTRRLVGPFGTLLCNLRTAAVVAHGAGPTSIAGTGQRNRVRNETMVSPPPSPIHISLSDLLSSTLLAACFFFQEVRGYRHPLQCRRASHTSQQLTPRGGNVGVCSMTPRTEANRGSVHRAFFSAKAKPLSMGPPWQAESTNSRRVAALSKATSCHTFCATCGQQQCEATHWASPTSTAGLTLS